MNPYELALEYESVRTALEAHWPLFCTTDDQRLDTTKRHSIVEAKRTVTQRLLTRVLGTKGRYVWVIPTCIWKVEAQS